MNKHFLPRKRGFELVLERRCTHPKIVKYRKIYDRCTVCGDAWVSNRRVL